MPKYEQQQRQSVKTSSGLEESTDLTYGDQVGDESVPLFTSPSSSPRLALSNSNHKPLNTTTTTEATVPILDEDSITKHPHMPDSGSSTNNTDCQKKNRFSPLYSVYVLMLLLIISIQSVLGRLILGIMLPYIKPQLNITDSQVGFLSGPLYSLLYCVSGVLFGKIGERISRKWIIAFSIGLAAASTTATGFSWSYWYLLLCRLGFAVAISGSSSLGISLLADYFPPYYRATTVAVYNWSSFCGMGVNFAVGALDNSDHADSENWRFVFYFMGIPGLVAGLLVLLTVKEPLRGRFDNMKKEDADEEQGKISSDEQQNIAQNSINNDELSSESTPTVQAPGKLRQYIGTVEMVRYIVRRPTFFLVCAAASCRVFAGLALASWLPSFYHRIHHANSTEQAKWLSWIIPMGGAAGVIFGGYYVDLWAKRDKRAPAYIALLSCFLSIPFAVSSLLIDHAIVSMFFMFPNMLVSEMWSGPAGSIMLEILPVSMRTLVYSIYYFTLSIVGGFGPMLVGYLNNYMSIRFSMLLVLPVFYCLASLFFWLSALTLRKDIEMKKVWEEANMEYATETPETVKSTEE